MDKEKPIVLVVDDSPDSLGMLNTSLDEAGFTVLIALSGQQALSIVEQIEPDVILMDGVMPNMDGFTCCARIRETHSLIPIIFMTGLSDEDDVVRAFESGGNDYIIKPIRTAELLVRIRSHLKHSRRLNEAHSALDTARQFIFACDDAGNILWATPEAQQLLEHSPDAAQMKDALERWLASENRNELEVRFAEQVMSIRYFKQSESGEHLLRIVQNAAMFEAPTLQSALSLTQRESEVLLWVAQGKSNKEIATILSMSPRTVNKHLEQLFPKIEVDNRTAATSLAIKVLLGYSG